MASEAERLPLSKAAVASFVLAAWVALECWSALFFCFISIDWNIERLARTMGWQWTGTIFRMFIILALWFVLPPVAIKLGIRGYHECQTGELRGRTWAVLGIVVATLDLSLKILFTVRSFGI
jgi:hypothetical protein